MALIPSAPVDLKQYKSNIVPSTIKYTPHSAEILSVQISPSGRTIATGSADKTINLTSLYGNQEQLLLLKGHKGAVLEIKWSNDGDRIISCSSDHTAAIWDLSTGQRLRRLIGHEDIINCCDIGKQLPNIAVTGSDDGNTLLWDLRVMRAVASFPERYQVLGVALDDILYRVFSGSLDNNIRVYDVRKFSISPPKPTGSTEETSPYVPLLITLTGHINAITGIDLSSNRNLLVSNSMDQSVRFWDVQPFCTKGGDQFRCVASISGPTHNFEQMLHRARWSPDDTWVGVGSADRVAYILNTQYVEENRPEIFCKLTGHAGAVTEVVFHPHEKIVVTAGVDREVFIRNLS